MNTLVLNIDRLSESGRRLIMKYAEDWKVPPSEAAARLLEIQAKRKPRKPRTQPETTEAGA